MVPAGLIKLWDRLPNLAAFATILSAALRASLDF